MISQFLLICTELQLPVALEKIEWSSIVLIFSGILLNGQSYTLSVPLEKQEKALRLLSDLTGKKKATVKQLQVLTGYLNFLTKVIVPGRTFTPRMYTKYSQKGKDKQLKPFHHVKLDEEFRSDCDIWHMFLTHSRNKAVCRPMVDLSLTVTAEQLMFSMDASANRLLGVGAYLSGHWFSTQWEPGFVQEIKPLIEYLELYGVTAALITWGHLIENKRIVIFCDNMAVVAMINNCALSCGHYMYLLKLIMVDNLQNNQRVFAKYISTQDNYLLDALSHLQMKRCWALAPDFTERFPTSLFDRIWPPTSVWNKI